MDKDNEKLLTWAAIIAGGWLFIELTGGVKTMLEWWGLKDSEQDKQLQEVSTSSTSWWSPTFYKDKTGARIMTRAKAEEMAANIYNAFGWFNDNEEQAIGVFKSLPTQAAGSWLADVFRQKYNIDLLTFLRGGGYPQDRLSDSDVAVITNYVNSLPVK